MKTLKYLLGATVGLLVVSCYSLDIPPKNVLGEDVLLGNDFGVRKFLAQEYHDLPIDDFHRFVNGSYHVTGNSNNRWEALKSSPAKPGGEGIGFGNAWDYEDFNYWEDRNDQGNSVWHRIRELNTFLANLPVDKYTPEVLNAYYAEARFLRAFYYFGLVKRYGGVPIISEVLMPNSPPDQIQRARATEYESWKFIVDELKWAMENGAAESEIGRANKYVAAALLSRVGVYAGSIAKYGGYVQTMGPSVTAGYQLMPIEKAEEFFQAAYDASKFVRDGGYALYNPGGTKMEKADAYYRMFIHPESHNEDIFVKQFTLLTGNGGLASHNTGLAHDWDGMVLPKDPDMKVTAPGATLCPSWNLIDLFEHPAIQTDEENPVPIRFDDQNEFWQSDETEARLIGSIYFNGMTEAASGVVFDMQAGVYLDYVNNGRPATVADGAPLEGNNEFTGNNGDENGGRRRFSNEIARMTQTINGETVKVTGKHGVRRAAEDRSSSGTIIRKYVSDDPGALRAENTGVQDWLVLRYGEVLLNWAEAAYELGLIKSDNALKQEAFEHIAMLRDRAGASPYTMKAAPVDLGMMTIEEGGLGYQFSVDENLQFIRDERARELCFENHRIYDLIRWRVADLIHKDYKIRKFFAYYVLSEEKWIFLPEIERGINFNKNRYYNQIPGGAINRNPALIINDGY